MARALFERFVRWRRWVAHDRKITAGDGRPNLQKPHAQTREELVKLAWPIAVAMAGDTMMGLVDTKLVGGLGPAALGGVGFATALMYLGYSLVSGVMRGVKVRTAYAVGQGRQQDGLRYAQAGLLMGAVAGFAIFLFGRDIAWLLRALALDESLVVPARDFFAGVTYGAPAISMLVALVQHRQAIGDSRTPMAIGLAANVVNAVLAYALIYGHGGLPALGVRGAGIATALVQYGELFVMAHLFLRDTQRETRVTLPLGAATREVLNLGLPTGLQFATETLAFTIFTAILGTLATAEIAAHQLALQTIRTSFLPGVAVAEAASILIGRALGQRKLDEADRVTRASLRLAVGFMALCGLIFGFFGGGLAGLFSDDAAVIHVARRLLLIAALFQVLDAVNIVLRSALRGAKDVRAVMILGVLVVWTFVPTSAFVLGKQLGLGAVGGWLGFVGETTIGALLFWLRWRRGGWRKDYA